MHISYSYLMDCDIYRINNLVEHIEESISGR
uniref:Uncharacterized protein n=1 Tax=Caudovirales sp. ctIbU14 TaxID=2825761 RepID=A0A8S5NRU2_9CAUD|nr:MAG TPA: hypothetical protein [Caudovirales sp. ctIbU14]